MDDVRMKTGLLSVGITLALAAACVFFLTWVDRRIDTFSEPQRKSSPADNAAPTRPAPDADQKTSTKTTAPAAPAFPYSECAECLRWTRERNGYPEEIEATWLGRKEWKNPDGSPSPTVVVTGRIRGRNTAGGKEVQTWEFIFDNGKFRNAQRVNN